MLPRAPLWLSTGLSSLIPHLTPGVPVPSTEYLALIGPCRVNYNENQEAPLTQRKRATANFRVFVSPFNGSP